MARQLDHETGGGTPESGPQEGDPMKLETTETNQSIGDESVRQTTLNEFVTSAEESTTTQTPPIRTDGGYDEDQNEDQSEQSQQDGQNVSISLTPSVREYVKTDRDHSCELCDEDEIPLEIHHRKQKSEGGTNHPDNLILLCQECHRKHHGNEPIDPQTVDDELGDNQLEEDSTTDETTDDTDPLPPHSDPNEADKEILSIIENEGPLSVGEIAARTDYTGQYIRRQAWKLAGEVLISRRDDGTLDLPERTSSDQHQIGLPDTPKSAARAGRDEIMRRMSAHGISHTQIADIAGLSRSTVDIAVNRARALRLDIDEPEEIDFAAVATRLSALVELIDRSRIDSC